MEETWKWIPGYEGLYKISNLGRVFSCRSNRYLCRKVYDDTYVQITLFKDGKNKDVYVHRLVAEAFLPNPDNLRCVNHKDFNKNHNAVENLEWVSHLDNYRHAKQGGHFGGNSKLTKEQAQEIVNRLNQGERGVDLAKEFGVSKWTISMIKHGNRRTYLRR